MDIFSAHEMQDDSRRNFRLQLCPILDIIRDMQKRTFYESEKEIKEVMKKGNLNVTEHCETREKGEGHKQLHDVYMLIY